MIGFGYVKGSNELERKTSAWLLEHPNGTFYGITSNRQIMKLKPPKWIMVPASELAEALEITDAEVGLILEARGVITLGEVLALRNKVIETPIGDEVSEDVVAMQDKDAGLNMPSVLTAGISEINVVPESANKVADGDESQPLTVSKSELKRIIRSEAQVIVTAELSKIRESINQDIMEIFTRLSGKNK